MAIKHSLHFISSNHGIREITEPVGFDGAEFVIEQDDNRLGRDVIYAGGSNRLTIYDCAEYDNVFSVLLYNIREYGFEAVIRYIISFNETVSATYELSDLETDDVTYISFTLIEKSNRALFKSRYDVPTNVMASQTLDGELLTPYNPTNIYLKAKPIIASSVWENPTIGLVTQHDNPVANADYMMVIKNQTKYDIKDSLNWFNDFNTDSGGAFEDFIFIDAKQNYRNITIQFDLNIVYDYLPQSGLDENGQILLRVYYGQTPETSTQIAVWNSTAFTQETPQQQIVPTSLTANIPVLNNTDKLWISFVSATGNGAINQLTWGECKITITATGIGKNSVIPAFRISEIMKDNAKKSANLPVDCPRFDEAGDYYDLFVTTQPLMRRLYDKEFNVTTKEIVEDFLSLFRGDYQLEVEDEVFYGIEQDFYRNYEIGNFTQDIYEYLGVNGIQGGQLQGYKKYTNPRYFINRFSFIFKKYASQREETTENTYDLVHGEKSHLLPNKKATNNKEVQVGWIFDAFLLAIAQANAYNLSDSTATQNDDDKYVIDCVPMETADRTVTETDTLQHEWNADADTLTLTNQQDFSWIQLGIIAGTPFEITSAENTGTYTVTNVEDLQITLQPISATPEDLITDNTTFVYYISPIVTIYKNRTDEGFLSVFNIEDGGNYPNLLYTVARSVKNFWQRYLAAAQFYKKDQLIRKTSYKNNPDAITWFTGESDPLLEGGNFTALDPIVTPFLYDVKLIMSLEDYFNLQRLQVEQKGYIRTWDSKGLPLRLFLRKSSFTILNKGWDDNILIGIAEATGEEKFEPFLLTIFGVAGGMITINGETHPDNLTYIVDDNGILSIFDGIGKLLYSPTPYDRVRVNNSGQADSVQELTGWLSAIL